MENYYSVANNYFSEGVQVLVVLKKSVYLHERKKIESIWYFQKFSSVEFPAFIECRMLVMVFGVALVQDGHSCAESEWLIDASTIFFKHMNLITQRNNIKKQIPGKLVCKISQLTAVGGRRSCSVAIS